MGEATSPPVYLSRNSKDEVWAKVSYLLPQLLSGEAVLLEAYCSPLKPGPRVEDRTWEQYTGEGFESGTDGGSSRFKDLIFMII